MELHALLTGLAISTDTLAVSDVDHWMEDFDKDNDGQISELEFMNGVRPQNRTQSVFFLLQTDLSLGWPS